jgi:hypothetical protein
MAKHYVMIDENGVILRGFSTDFEQPADGDVCICEDGGRHFELNGVINPPLTNHDGIPLYKIVKGKVVARTAKEIDAEKAEFISVPTLEERLAEVEALVKGTPTYGELLEAVNILLGETP